MDKKSDTAWINAVNIVGETPVHIAARRRILDLFEYMLPYCNDIEACDDQGNTVLHQLVDSDAESDEEHKQKRIDLLRIVISKGADVNKRNRRGSTSVHLAAKHCHIEVLRVLKRNGAELGLRNGDGESALLLACKHMFKLRGTPAEMDIIDFLMSDACDVNAVDYEGFSALHYAVQWCSGKTVIKLIEAGADVHCRTKERQFTPLHLAAKRRNPNKLNILVQSAANVNSEDIDKLTPLHLALLEGTAEVVERLIKYGSNLGYPDAILQFTPLHVAVYQQRDDLVKLLIDGGANVNSSGVDGSTPLHLSSVLGNLAFTKILIDHGADVNARDKNDLTPLHLAIRRCYDLDQLLHDLRGTKAVIRSKKDNLIVKLLTCEHAPTDEDYEAVVNLLIDNGADVNVMTKLGENLVYMAVEANNINLVKMLLEIGVDVNCKSLVSEFTPLHLAAYNSYKAVAELLMNAGADVNALTKNGKNPLHLTVESNCGEIHGPLNEQANLLGFTPLASSKNYKNVVEILINAGAIENTITLDGRSLVHSVLESNCKEVLLLLASRGAKLHCNGKRCLYTLLYIVVENSVQDINNKFQDLEKTPLLVAIDRLQNAEVKKALLSLCALVNAGNQNDCMTVNNNITHNFMYNLKCLLAVGFDINDYDVFVKLIFGYPRNDGFAPFDTCPVMSTVKPFSDDYRTKTSHGLLGLIADLRSQSNEYRQEVENLKKYFINDDVTLYDLLHMKFKRRRLYTDYLNLSEIMSKFPIYYELILARYREADIRKILLEVTQMALRQLIDVDFPIVCIETIFSNVEIINMIATIEAAELIY
ncbi:ankyrin-1-like [Phymastichus coffea]|uniref:ankyrin-1-like n=1 Tax=Phymastichus coffea TaxID=108790 RepID=UPI00273B7735|nr:ankyrin-1-like [Phymastichus coffea]